MDYENYINQIKLFYLVVKIGGDVFVQTLKTLYQGPLPIESHLVDVADEKTSKINKDEKELLQNIKSGLRDLKCLDLTLSFKLIQLTSCLEPKHSSFSSQCVWTKRCPKEKQNFLEHLLFKFKTEKNKLIRNFATMSIITDEMFYKLKNEYVNSLKLIVEKLGERANLSKQDVRMRLNRINMESEIFIQQLTLGSRKRSETCTEGFREAKSAKEKLKRSAKSENDLQREIVDKKETPDLLKNVAVEPNKVPSQSKIKRAISSYIGFLFNKKSNNNYNESQKAHSSSTTPIDFSPLVRKTLLTAYGRDLEQESHGIKPYEKSNRMYWINQLVSSNTIQDQRQLKTFWKGKIILGK